MSRKWESQMRVAKLSREDELQRGIAKIKKFRGVCNRFPEGSTKLIKKNV